MLSTPINETSHSKEALMLYKCFYSNLWIELNAVCLYWVQCILRVGYSPSLLERALILLCTLDDNKNVRKTCTLDDNKNVRKTCTLDDNKNVRKTCTLDDNKNVRKTCTLDDNKNVRKTCTLDDNKNVRKTCALLLMYKSFNYLPVHGQIKEAIREILYYIASGYY